MSKPREIACPKCKTKYRNLSDNIVGKSVKCGHCGHSFRVQSRSQSSKNNASEENWKSGDTILGLYKVQDIVGSGSFGQVYRIFHSAWQTELALKIPHASALKNPRSVENVEREAETWVNIGLHPNVASCYYVRRVNGIPHLFAEFISGGTLSDWIKAEKIYQDEGNILARLLDISIQMAWGLHYAHQQNLIHQDVKPANVLMTEEGVVKITDFGLANAAHATTIFTRKHNNEEDTLIVDGIGMTPAYASPEQIDRQQLTRRADIWSWAVVVLEMFNGVRTWSNGSEIPKIFQEYCGYGPLDDDIPKMPETLKALIGECLQLDPEARPRDLELVAAEIIKLYEVEVGQTYPRSVPEAGRDTPDNLNNRAVSLLDLEKYADAETCWKRALKIQPGHIATTYNWELFRWRRGYQTDEELLERLNAVCAAHPSAALPRYLTSQAQLERGDGEATQKLLHVLDSNLQQRPEIEHLNSQAETGRVTSIAMENSHEYGIAGLTLSPDSTHAISGSIDKTLKYWSLKDGECLRTLEKHTWLITAVCMSPNGRYIISAGDDRALYLWDSEHLHEPLLLEQPDDSIWSLAVDKGGRYALSGRNNGVIRLWDMDKRVSRVEFQGHAVRVSTLGLDVRRRRAISVDVEHNIKLWQLPKDHCVRTIEGGQLDDMVAAICPDARYVMTGGAGTISSDEHFLSVWDVVNDDFIGNFTTPRRITSIALSRDAEYGLVGHVNGCISVWDIENGRCLRTLKAHQEAVTALNLNITFDRVISGSQDGEIKFWDISALTQSSYTAPLHLSQVLSSEQLLTVQNSYDEALTAAQNALAQQDYTTAMAQLREARAQPGHGRAAEALTLWRSLYRQLPKKELTAVWEAFELRGHAYSPCALQAGFDGKTLFSLDVEGIIKQWETETWQCTQTTEAHKEKATAIAVNEAMRYVASTGQSDLPEIKLWQYSSQEFLRSFQDNETPATCIRLSADGRFTVSGHADGEIRVWDSRSGRNLNELSGHVEGISALALSSDERHIFSAGHDNTIRWWNLNSGKCLQVCEGHTAPVTCLEISADDRLALSGSLDGSLRLWQPSTGVCLSTIAALQGEVKSLAMTPDGRFAVSAGADNTIKFWDLENGVSIYNFGGGKEVVTCLAVAFDGSYVFSGHEGGRLSVWALDWELDEASHEEGMPDIALPYLRAFTLRYAKTSSNNLPPPPALKELPYKQLQQRLSILGFGHLSIDIIRKHSRNTVTKRESNVRNRQIRSSVQKWSERTGLVFTIIGLALLSVLTSALTVPVAMTIVSFYILAVILIVQRRDKPNAPNWWNMMIPTLGFGGSLAVCVLAVTQLFSGLQ
ncbi:MAG: protein kinase [Pseudomonadota bacterium]